MWKCENVEMWKWLSEFENIIKSFRISFPISTFSHFHIFLMLYIVPTPIGNLKDITLRALDILKEVDLILAEDTRTSSHLLNHYQVNKPMTPYHQHNEHKVLQHLVSQMQEGKKMAVITDAGTPGISDPAFLLIRECIKVGIPVECLPGATAFVPALVNSGIPTNRFCFEGFLPLKKGKTNVVEAVSR